MAYNTLPGEATREGPGEAFAPDVAPASTQPSAGSPFEGDAHTRGPAGPEGPQGPQGDPGPMGTMGIPGVDVTGAMANRDAATGLVTVTYELSDGSTFPVTYTVPDGAAATEIDSGVVNVDGTITFGLADGSSFTTTGTSVIGADGASVDGVIVRTRLVGDTTTNIRFTSGGVEIGTADIMIPDGADGAAGVDGDTVAIFWADDAAGTNASQTRGATQTFIQFVIYDPVTTPVTPTSGYVDLRGLQGEQGATEDVTVYFADDSSGTNASTTRQANQYFYAFVSHIRGQTPSLATATFVDLRGPQGADGAAGDPGAPGANGISTAVFYADDATGTNASQTRGVGQNFFAFALYTPPATPTAPTSFIEIGAGGPDIGGRAWSTTEQYASGDLVSHIGRTYQAIATPTIGESPNGTVGQTEWKLVVNNEAIDANVTDSIINQTTAPSRRSVENLRVSLLSSIADTVDDDPFLAASAESITDAPSRRRVATSFETVVAEIGQINAGIAAEEADTQFLAGILSRLEDYNASRTYTFGEVGTTAVGDFVIFDNGLWRANPNRIQPTTGGGDVIRDFNGQTPTVEGADTERYWNLIHRFSGNYYNLDGTLNTPSEIQSGDMFGDGTDNYLYIGTVIVSIPSLTPAPTTLIDNSVRISGSGIYSQGNGITVDDTTDTLSVRLGTDSGLHFQADGGLSADPAEILRGLSSDNTTDVANPIGGVIELNSGLDTELNVSSNSIVVNSTAAQPWMNSNGYLAGSIVSAGTGDHRQLFISLRVQEPVGTTIPNPNITTDPLSATRVVDGNWALFQAPSTGTHDVDEFRPGWAYTYYDLENTVNRTGTVGNAVDAGMMIFSEGFFIRNGIRLIITQGFTFFNDGDRFAFRTYGPCLLYTSPSPRDS